MRVRARVRGRRIGEGLAKFTIDNTIIVTLHAQARLSQKTSCAMSYTSEDTKDVFQKIRDIFSKTTDIFQKTQRTFPKKQGTFSQKQRTFPKKQGTFSRKQGTYSQKQRTFSYKQARSPHRKGFGQVICVFIRQPSQQMQGNG